jgi:hypothetical protein
MKISQLEKDYCINIFSRNTLRDRDVKKKHGLFSQTEEFEFEKKVIRITKNEFLHVNKFLQYRPVEEVLNMYLHGTMPLKEIMTKTMFLMVFVSNSTNNTKFNSDIRFKTDTLGEVSPLDIVKLLREETGVLSLDDVDFRLIINEDDVDGKIFYDKMAHLYAKFIDIREEEVQYTYPNGSTVEVARDGQLFIAF